MAYSRLRIIQYSKIYIQKYPEKAFHIDKFLAKTASLPRDTLYNLRLSFIKFGSPLTPSDLESLIEHAKKANYLIKQIGLV